MILYFMVMVALMCVFLGMGLWKLVSGQWEIGRKPDPVPSRPRPKPVAPFPFGPIADLIKDAEARAEREFYELFPEERPDPDPPGGYAMDSSPKGIIVSNGVMTANERRTLLSRMHDRQASQQVMILPEDTEYHGIANPPKMIDVGTVNEPYQRYIEGIGIIHAASAHNLERACEVAVMEKFRESEATMRYLDGQIRSAMGVPPHSVPSAKDMAGLKEKRRDAWENCKLYLELLQELNL